MNKKVVICTSKYYIEILSALENFSWIDNAYIGMQVFIDDKFMSKINVKGNPDIPIEVIILPYDVYARTGKYEENKDSNNVPQEKKISHKFLRYDKAPYRDFRVIYEIVSTGYSESEVLEYCKKHIGNFKSYFDIREWWEKYYDLEKTVGRDKEDVYRFVVISPYLD